VDSGALNEHPVQNRQNRLCRQMAAYGFAQANEASHREESHAAELCWALSARLLVSLVSRFRRRLASMIPNLLSRREQLVDGSALRGMSTALGGHG
jgi:hypothetical protein